MHTSRLFCSITWPAAALVALLGCDKSSSTDADITPEPREPATTRHEPATSKRKLKPAAAADADSVTIATPNRTFNPQQQQFIDHMRKALPAALCKDTQFFRQCFSLTNKQCNDSVRRHFDTCLNKHLDDIPEVINAQTGEKAGGVLGMCVGTNYELGWRKDGKFIDTPRCQDPSQWPGG